MEDAGSLGKKGAGSKEEVSPSMSVAGVHRAELRDG